MRSQRNLSADRNLHLPLMLKNQSIGFLCIWKWNHHWNRPANLRIWFIEPHQKLHHFLLFFSNNDFLQHIARISEGILVGCEFVPKSLEFCIICGYKERSLAAFDDLLADLLDSWSISLRESIMKVAPNCCYCVRVDDAAGYVRSYRMKDPGYYKIVATSP